MRIIFTVVFSVTLKTTSFVTSFFTAFLFQVFPVEFESLSISISVLAVVPFLFALPILFILFHFQLFQCLWSLFSFVKIQFSGIFSLFENLIKNCAHHSWKLLSFLIILVVPFYANICTPLCPFPENCMDLHFPDC